MPWVQPPAQPAAGPSPAPAPVASVPAAARAPASAKRTLDLDDSVNKRRKRVHKTTLTYRQMQKLENELTDLVLKTAQIIGHRDLTKDDVSALHDRAMKNGLKIWETEEFGDSGNDSDKLA